MGRVLILTIRGKGGGAEKIIDNLVKSRTYDFEWLNMESSLSHPFLYRYINFLWAVYKKIGGVDKVIIGTEGVLGLIIFPFKLLSNKKFILWEHCYFNDYKKFLSKKNRFFYKISYLLYPLKINASPASKDGIFIPNPYLFTMNPISNKFIGCKSVILLSISSLAKLKRVDLTIELVSSLSSCFKLKIYGDGIEKNYLKRLVVQKNIQERTCFLGFKDYPFDIDKAAARILIINSETEALPTIILEAIENNVPVIVSEYTGVEYWQGLNTVFILAKITPANIVGITEYFKCLSEIKYAELFNRDMTKLKKRHDYKKFINCLVQV